MAEGELRKLLDEPEATCLLVPQASVLLWPGCCYFIRGTLPNDCIRALLLWPCCRRGRVVMHTAMNEGPYSVRAAVLPGLICMIAPTRPLIHSRTQPPS